MCSIANEVIQVRKIYKASSWTNKGNTERYEACSELVVGSFLWMLDPCFSLKWQNLSRFISHFMIEYHVSICLVIDLCICIFLKNHYEYFSRCLRKGVARCCLVQVYLMSASIFRDFCQPFHNPVSNNLLVNENVGDNRSFFFSLTCM